MHGADAGPGRPVPGEPSAEKAPPPRQFQHRVDPVEPGGQVRKQAREQLQELAVDPAAGRPAHHGGQRVRGVGARQGLFHGRG